MKIVNEFKVFAMRGNVIDMAVGIIIGSAFGKIISSLVADVIMPPIGLLLGGIKFTELKVKLNEPVLDASGEIITQAVSINYGNFIQATVDFLIIAICIFLMIKAINSFRKKVEKAPDAEPAPIPTKEEVLLGEIRDLLKKDRRP